MNDMAMPFLTIILSTLLLLAGAKVTRNKENSLISPSPRPPPWPREMRLLSLPPWIRLSPALKLTAAGLRLWDPTTTPG